MARSVAWRRTVSDAASWHQDQALSATIYILRETGPTGFLLKEEGEAKKVKVFLGDPHSCTCSVFQKERDLCKHICWVLLKKFRVPRQNPISFQLGLVEREINEILRGINSGSRQGGAAHRERATSSRKVAPGAAPLSADGREVLSQREITEDDVCPICQEELLNAREAVTYCRYGCAKSIHIKCMKVWAEHQRSVGETLIRCPLCREDFGQLEQLQAEYRNASLQRTRAERLDVHTGICCQHCNKSPVQGKCYRCTECFDYCLCHACFLTNIHSEHSFKFRQKMNQRWRPAQRGSGSALPQAVLDDLLAREISEGDYDLLLQLDSQTANQPSNIPEKVIKGFPTETVRQGSVLLHPGVQCRVCLRGYSVGQVLRRLPCRHKFHTSCIDPWLLHQHPTCPVDGSLVWSPGNDEPSTLANQNQRSKLPANGSVGAGEALDIPGIGVTSVRLGRSGDAVSKGRLRGRPRIVERAPSEDVEGLAADFALTGLGIASHGRPQRDQPNSREMTRLQPRRNGSPRAYVDFDIGGDGVADPAINMEAINAIASANNDSGLSQDLPFEKQSGELRQGHVNGQPAQPENWAYNSSSRSVHHSRIEQDTAGGNSQVPVPPRLETLILPGATTSTKKTRHQPLRGAALTGRPPLPTQPLVDLSTAPSIPLRRESAMAPIGNSRQQSTSAPSPGQRTVPLEAEGSPGRRPPLPTGGSPGSVRDRGRQPVRNVRSTPPRRARSISVERSRSRERLHPPNVDKQQVLEDLFLGLSPGGQHVPLANSSGQVKGRRSSPLRSRVGQFHGGAQVKREEQLSEGISGSGLSSQVQ
ncbi:E3 ubiquitin-protein ligase Zswim2-like [Acanthaster planci]|uniref:E3 ubiquitin-protein ligase Zswim2-like n=1 Tax=Acanthaster planci TaxID=133434 RepID=A0A8B7XJC9_ACAPL|nr:E3 ubiquitin-protein ligase Zswim2-like [Acanthaster planci]XP_022080050.1 E3 ubiquitin-protein ligase Zswim2-like [Acanthaster planci]